MRGYVEKISKDAIQGWAFDPQATTPIVVQAWLGDEMLAAGITDILRPSLDKASHETVSRGYRLPITLTPNRQIEKIRVYAYNSNTGDWLELPRSNALIASHRNAETPKSYQDFDGTGSSKSHEKLKALKLSRINQGNFTGLSVLDIGCNEGFFCREALRLGANRVVGIDSNKSRIALARMRVPGAEFINTRWSSLPDETFDVIFFLSAIHYEKDQKTLLQEIRSHLNPTGTLILECGIAEVTEEKWFKTVGRRSWHSVMRRDGLKRYPTYDMLTQELLSDYSVLTVGKSVMQGGDPVPRWVLHCSPKAPTAILIVAASGSGKTSLAFGFERAGIPCFRLDPLLDGLARNDRYSWSNIAKSIRLSIDVKTHLSLKQVADVILSDKLENELVDLIWNEIPRETNTFVIEGEALTRPSILKELTSRLQGARIRPWIMTPSE